MPHLFRTEIPRCGKSELRLQKIPPPASKRINFLISKRRIRKPKPIQILIFHEISSSAQISENSPRMCQSIRRIHQITHIERRHVPVKPHRLQNFLPPLPEHKGFSTLSSTHRILHNSKRREASSGGLADRFKRSAWLSFVGRA